MLTPEQLQLRKTGIGGSDAPAVCNRSRFDTPLGVYMSKTTNLIKKPTKAMIRGSILEPFVRSLFEHKTGLKVEIKDTIRSEDHQFMLANIDGYIPSERAILEIKTQNIARICEWGDEDSEEMPDEYILQDAHYRKVTGVDFIYTAVLFATEERFDELCDMQNLIEEGHKINFDEHSLIFKTFKYQPCEVLEKNMVSRERSFWFDYVEKRILPPFEYNMDELIKAYPNASDRTLLINDKQIQQVEELKSMKELKDNLKKKEELIKANIMKDLGNAYALIGEDGKELITWKNQQRNAVNMDYFKATYPDIYQDCLETTVSRTFRAK